MLVLALAAVALATSLALVASASRPREDGPIRYDGTAGVTWTVPRAQTFTWTMLLPQNPTLSDIHLRSVEPVGTRGLEVLGALVAYGCGLPTTALGCPPSSMPTVLVERATLPARGDPCATPTAVIGLRRDGTATSGTVEGLRLRYESGGTTYETTLALKILVTDP